MEESINIFKLEEYLSQYEFSAKYLLRPSDAESFTMSNVLAMTNIEEKKLWENLRLGYTEYQGLPLLRQTIAHELYNELDQDNILTFAGAEEGIFCTIGGSIL